MTATSFRSDESWTRLTTALPRADSRRLRNLVDLHLIDLAVVGEDHQISVRRGDEKMLDEILVLRRRAQTAFAAASLTRICRDRRALDVAGFGYRDRDVFVGDQVFDGELDAGVDDLRAARVAKLLS